ASDDDGAEIPDGMGAGRIGADEIALNDGGIGKNLNADRQVAGDDVPRPILGSSNRGARGTNIDAHSVAEWLSAVYVRTDEITENRRGRNYQDAFAVVARDHVARGQRRPTNHRACRMHLNARVVGQCVSSLEVGADEVSHNEGAGGTGVQEDTGAHIAGNQIECPGRRSPNGVVGAGDDFDAGNAISFCNRAAQVGAEEVAPNQIAARLVQNNPTS